MQVNPVDGCSATVVGEVDADNRHETDSVVRILELTGLRATFGLAD